MFETVKLIALENLAAAFTKKAGNAKGREALANEFVKRSGKVLSYTDQQKLRIVLIEFAKNWK